MAVRTALALASSLTKAPLNIAPPGHASGHPPGAGTNGKLGSAQTHAPVLFSPLGPVPFPSQRSTSGGIAGFFNSTLNRNGTIPTPINFGNGIAVPLMK